MTDHCQSSG